MPGAPLDRPAAHRVAPDTAPARRPAVADPVASSPVNLRVIGALLGASMTLLACASTIDGSGLQETSPVGGSTAAISPPASGPIGSPTSSGAPPSQQNPYTRPELPAARAIQGVVYTAEPDHLHMPGTLSYDTTPPTGGNHSLYWADCTGTSYPNAIANENAVHMLEHGAVWITYKPGLAADQLNVLKQLVTGQNYMALSPYPGLKTNISLQSWNYQLFVDKASDARIQQFIATLRNNPLTTPEVGASCAQATFKSHPSTFGKPLSGPAA